MQRIILLTGVVVIVALTAATGGIAAQHYLINSANQVRPGSIALRNLNQRTRKLVTRPSGKRGPRGWPGSGDPLAQASGLDGWTSDPALLSSSHAASSGSIHGGSVWLNRGSEISWLAEVITQGGSGMTHAAYAIYDAHLHLVARTADSPSSFQGGSTARWVKLPLTTPYAVPASGLYYFVDLLAGARPPQVAVAVRNRALTVRNDLPNGVPRGIRGGSGFSTFPAALRNTGTDETRAIVGG